MGEVCLQPKVSVIIPAYNAEKTLKRCLDSVFAQDFDSYEVILVNDGSKDGTHEVARDYERFPNFTLIDKENEGVSRARWEGLIISKGEFIAFVDADDYVAINMLSRMYFKAKEDNADLVISNWFKVSSNRIFPKKPYQVSEVVLRSDELIDLVIFTHDNPGLWNKLWGKDLLLDSNLQETFDLSYGEDLLFCLNVFSNVNRPTFVTEPLYFHVISPESVSHNLKTAAISDYVSVLEKFSLFLGNSPDGNFLTHGTSYYSKQLFNRYKQLCKIGHNNEEIAMEKDRILKMLRGIPFGRTVRSKPGCLTLMKMALVKLRLFSPAYDLLFSPSLFPLRNLIRSLFGKLKN